MFEAIELGVHGNTVVGWLLNGLVFMGGVEDIPTDHLLWGLLAVIVGAAITLPAIATRDWTAIPP